MWKPPIISLVASTRPAAVAALLLVALAPASAAPPPGEPGWCGAAGVEQSLVDAARSAFYLERQFELRSRSAPSIAREGEIAVIVDDGSIFAGNPFDLATTALRFTPRAGGYKSANLGQPRIGAPSGERLELGDDDSAFVALPGFTFPFYGRSYDGVWVNSDGNLTFDEASGGASARDALELISGPPRIAALLADLDPGLATDRAGVYVDSRAGSWLRVTWSQVPIRLTVFTATLEITLHSKGRIDLALAEVGPVTGVVGLSPGRTRSLELVDFSRRRVRGRRGVALAEEFTGIDFDAGAIGRTFFSRFADQYTTLVTWFDFPVNLGFLASHRLVANRVDGIGLPRLNFGGLYDSVNLEGYVTMGGIDRYPDDPDLTFSNTFSTMDVLGHEVGHRWLAFVRFDDGTPEGSRRLLGRQIAHWSFFVDTDASLMEGNDLLDLGRRRFRTVDASQGYGPLDLYLMGLLPAEEVPPFFWVEGNQGAAGPRPSQPPQIGIEFTGRRRDLTIEDIIAHEGRRFPSGTGGARGPVATAFVLVVPEGRTARPESIAKLERFRERWEEFFAEATAGRGSVTTRLVEKGD